MGDVTFLANISPNDLMGSGLLVLLFVLVSVFISILICLISTLNPKPGSEIKDVVLGAQC
jgi:hypothetical protein